MHYILLRSISFHRAFLAVAASLLIVICHTTNTFATPAVISVTPVGHSLKNAPDGDIMVTMTLAIDPSSLNNQTVQLFGRWSGPAPASLQLENNGTQIRITPLTPFFYGEWVSVALSKGIQDTAGDSLSLGYNWGFWTDCKPGTMNLSYYDELPVRFLNEDHIQTYGAYAGDLNNDGWTDLALPNELSNDIRVFLNDGSGDYNSFTRFPMVGGSRPSPSEGADFNADGEIDIAVGNSGNNQLSVLFGDGTGALGAANNYTAGQHVRGIGVGDLDGDGDADIVTANRTASTISVFLNDGLGTHSLLSSFDAGVSGETTLAMLDINNDGNLDLFIGAYFSEQLTVWLGDGAGGFAHASTMNGIGASWTIAAGDLNRDGFVDVVSANSFDDHLSVMFGDGAGGLNTLRFYLTGEFPLSIDLGDLDGDGDLDMISSNYAGVNFTQYENTGGGFFFNRQTYPAKSAGSCVILHDRDNDGDLDATLVDEIEDYIILYNNGCCDTPGDADGSGVVTIGDVTFLVEFIFSAGTPAECADEADADRNDSVNIGDVTYLIAWIFSGGSAPICGGTGM